jgi:hypothetical protein
MISEYQVILRFLKIINTLLDIISTLEVYFRKIKILFIDL